MFSHGIKRIISDPSLIKYYFKRTISIVRIMLAYLYVNTFKSELFNKNIWIITEKGTEARDNGYCFFKFIKEEYPEINAYFVMTKDSPDYYKVAKYKSVVPLNSFKHFCYSLAAKVNASSQPYGAFPSPTSVIFQKAKKFFRKDQVVIHLKHGITKDELPRSLDYANTHFDLLCCVSPRERKFMHEVHGYPYDVVKLTGFCRFDNLLKDHIVKKQILIMPSHRMWLHAADTSKQATNKEITVFENTEYYKTYADLLSDGSLLKIARKNGYKIVFYPHYAQQSFISCFMKYNNDFVTIADRNHFDVQQLLLESALLITDYSSVFFDFAYMGKPVVFFHFDEKKYRAKHFKPGYFDYHIDGFGPIFNDKKRLLSEISQIINNDCKMDEIYLNRVNTFFPIRDTHNCERVFNEVYRKTLEK